MSRAYRISIEESLQRHVQVDDGVCSKLELLPILSRERTADLLAVELEKRGFKRDGDKAVREEKDGITVEVSLSDGEVKVSAKGSKEVELTAHRTGVTVEEVRHSREAELRNNARASLEAEAKNEEEKLRQEVTERLSGRLKDLKGELDGVVNKVTAASLKERASQLGTVEEVHENAETGELTIAGAGVRALSSLMRPARSCANRAGRAESQET